MGRNRTDPKGLLTGVKWDFIKGYKVTYRPLGSYPISVTVLVIGSLGQDQGGFECQGEGCTLRFKVRNVCFLIRLFSEWSLRCDRAPGRVLALGIQTLSLPREVPWPDQRPQGQAAHTDGVQDWGVGAAANRRPEPHLPGQPVLSPTPRKSGRGRRSLEIHTGSWECGCNSPYS